jgi:hypothetical protein
MSPFLAYSFKKTAYITPENAHEYETNQDKNTCNKFHQMSFAKNTHHLSGYRRYLLTGRNE